MGEPPRQQSNDAAIRADIDKNVILERTRWTDLDTGPSLTSHSERLS